MSIKNVFVVLACSFLLLVSSASHAAPPTPQDIYEDACDDDPDQLFDSVLFPWCDCSQNVNDCAGNCNGGAYVDQCGTCDSNANNDCVQDCAGFWGGDGSTCTNCDEVLQVSVVSTCQEPPFVDRSVTIADCDGNPLALLNAPEQPCSQCWLLPEVDNDTYTATICATNAYQISAFQSQHFGSSALDAWDEGGFYYYLPDCHWMVTVGEVTHTIPMGGQVADSPPSNECYDCAGCDCAGSVVDCTGECGGSLDLDECGVCGGGGIAAGACDCAGNVNDCAGVCGGVAVVDECGVCGGGGIAAGACDCAGNIEDCAGECGGSLDLDECGVCNGGGIAAGACDCAGNVNDCAGVCGGSAVLSGCDNACSSTAVVDCAGVCGGSAVLSGCDNACNSTAVVDECGVCGGDGIADGACDCEGNVLDCAGECGGAAIVDDSGFCGDENAPEPFTISVTYCADEAVSGFQFNVSGASFDSSQAPAAIVSGGAAADADYDFAFDYNGNTVYAFSFSGDMISAADGAVLIELTLVGDDHTVTSDNITLTEITVIDVNGSALPVSADGLHLSIGTCSGGADACDPTSWVGYDDLTCGDCAALVNVRDYGGTCRAFCELQGLSCVSAWDDSIEETCSPEYQASSTYTCDFEWTNTSDAICECGVCDGSGLNANDCCGNDAPDCLGSCGGTAQLDDCGHCNGDGIAAGACDCAGNVNDCAGVCGGSAVLSGCDNACSSTAVVDECGVCGGDGIADGACDCDGNIEDCAGVCGGVAVVDECGVCNGSGIPSGDCDCFGNVDLGCGVPWDETCDQSGEWDDCALACALSETADACKTTCEELGYEDTSDYLKGDLDENGEVDVIDVVWLIGRILGWN